MRNYSLEFMRIFLILLVVWGHLISQLPILKQSVGIYPNSQMAVQSFFMLGSFFAYFNLKKYNFGELIVKIYHRLFSPFLFTVILSILFSYSSFFDFFKALFLLPGLYPNSQITGWGDWFLGVYFWVICFYIYIYIQARENGQIL